MVKVSRITKRDGRIVRFDETKIVNAILEALKAVEMGDGAVAEQLSEDVVRRLNERFADLLILLGVPYDSEEALALAEKVMKFVSDKATQKSVEIGEKRGAFPNFRGSLWEKKGYKTIRNSTVTTVAPTGTISIIAGCSGGIEPIFAVAFVRNVMDGTMLLEIQPTFETIAKERGFYSKDLMMEVAKTGSIQNLEVVPEDVRRFFVTSLDINPEWHVRIQAAFQKYVDNAVSKTVNLPPDATVEDVRRVYMLAYKLKRKGITFTGMEAKKSKCCMLVRC